MPNRDGTGPRCFGQLTGKGFGPCGCGMLRGRGFARKGITKDEEIACLKSEQEEINKRLDELRKQ